MAQLIVRRLDDAVKERLRARAKRRGRSLEAEARAILEQAAGGDTGSRSNRKKEKGFGTLMHEQFGRRRGLTEEEYALFQKAIDDLNGRSMRSLLPDKKRTVIAAVVPGFGTRAAARFKGIGLSRRELNTFNREVDQRRKQRPRLARLDR